MFGTGENSAKRLQRTMRTQTRSSNTRHQTCQIWILIWSNEPNLQMLAIDAASAKVLASSLSRSTWAVWEAHSNAHARSGRDTRT